MNIDLKTCNYPIDIYNSLIIINRADFPFKCILCKKKKKGKDEGVRRQMEEENFKLCFHVGEPEFQLPFEEC